MLKLSYAHFKGPSTRANLTAYLPAQTGLRRQERACGHYKTDTVHANRAAWATFIMSKIKLRKLDRTVNCAPCGHLSCRVFSFIWCFFARGNRKMRASSRPQAWPMSTSSSHELKFARTYLRRVDAHQVCGGKSAQVSLRFSLHVWMGLKTVIV